MGHLEPIRHGSEGLVLLLEVEGLVALPLPDRIVAERRHAVTGKENGGTLVPASSFSRMAVSTWDKNTGPRAFTLGQIEVSTDMMPRSALEKDILNAIALALQSTHDPGLEWRPFWKSPNCLEEKLPPFLLPTQAIGTALDLLISFLPLLDASVELLHPPLFENPTGIVSEHAKRLVLSEARSGKREDGQPAEKGGTPRWQRTRAAHAYSFFLSRASSSASRFFTSFGCLEKDSKTSPTTRSASFPSSFRMTISASGASGDMFGS